LIDSGRRFGDRSSADDHIAMNVANRADLDAWAVWLDSQGVSHSGVNHTDDPIPYSALIIRDPDNIQLELVHLAG
jgi:glyoxylase I family protein